jgi:hypothetical protein
MNPNPSLERYKEALSKVVCIQCLEKTGRGICSIGGSEECAINRYLPEVVSIVETIESSTMHDYVHELHNVVCVSCRENQDGFCKLRSTPGCELDLYFPLIVQTIKKIQANKS